MVLFLAMLRGAGSQEPDAEEPGGKAFEIRWDDVPAPAATAHEGAP
jgi:hypothetical protein